MSFDAIRAAMALELRCTDKMVVLVLANFHNGKTGRCDPEKESIARACGLCKRAVDKALLRLKKDGVIDYKSTNGRCSNGYTLLFIQGSAMQHVQGSRNSNPASSSSDPASSSSNPASRAPESIQTRNEPKKEAAAASPREMIFTAGLSILTKAGTPERSARSFLGRYAKQDESKLAEIIGYLSANPKVEPKAYIAAAFNPQKRRVVI